MSYVTPNSDIEIFKNIPWDNTYEHTLYFVGQGNNTASYYQNLLFSNLRSIVQLQRKYQPRRYTAYSYQRKNINTIKLNEHPDDIYDYNYMRFKNTSHGNKWFYAFINDVEYVNENTALIHYEIDVLQTYLDEMELKESYVERKHTATDVIGENLEPEPLDFGEYVNLSLETPWNFNNYSLLMFYADADTIDVDPGNSVTIEITDIIRDTDTNILSIKFDFYGDTDWGEDDITWETQNIPVGTMTYNFDGNDQRLDVINVGESNTIIQGIIKIKFESRTYGIDIFENNSFSMQNYNIGDTITLPRVEGD
ncbi:MAG: hypothetical protein J6V44_09535 [Methanobrevibacter sp.]|nr:hypothetical protein [Methanobrevibacter sp.]